MFFADYSLINMTSRHALLQLRKLCTAITLRSHIVTVTRPIEAHTCISFTHPTFQTDILRRSYSFKKGSKKQKHGKFIDSNEDDSDSPDEDDDSNSHKSGKKKASASNELGFDVEALEDRMKNTVEKLQKDYSVVRIGRANPGGVLNKQKKYKNIVINWSLN
jgi:hypothetical protein